ncbi:MAG: hypothetical protein AAGD07_06310 [Planctomycetota bacterium]
MNRVVSCDGQEDVGVIATLMKRRKRLKRMALPVKRLSSVSRSQGVFLARETKACET